MRPLVTGVAPVRTHSMKCDASTYSGSLLSSLGARMSPVRYESWNSPKSSGSLKSTPWSNSLTFSTASVSS